MQFWNWINSSIKNWQCKSRKRRRSYCARQRYLYAIRGLQLECLEPKILLSSSVFGSNYTNYSIPDVGNWQYSAIAISGAPTGAVVTDVNVYYKIHHAYAGDLVVDLEVQNDSANYNLRDREGGGLDNPSGTVNGIDAFDGLNPNRTWYLYARDYESGDAGYIDEWTIRIYYDIPVTSPSKPTGLSPANDEIITDMTPTLDWNNVSNADSYEINISHYPYGSSNIVYSRSGIRGTSYTIPSGYLENGMQYRWDVTAVNTAGETTSNNAYFETATTTPAIPVTIGPGLTSSPGPVESDLTPTFDWNDVPGATWYEINIRNLNTNALITQQVTSSQYIPNTPLAAGTPYKWDVTAGNSSSESNPSTDRYFTTQTATVYQPNLVPQNVSLGSSTVQAGNSLSVSWLMANAGLGNATATVTGIRLGTSSTSHPGPEGNLVSNFTTPAINSNNSTSQSTTVTIPQNTAQGTYYIWIVADNSSPETLNQSNTSDDYAVSASFTVASSTPIFGINDRVVSSTDNLNIRNAAGGTAIGTARLGDRGTIIDVPVIAMFDGIYYTWYKVNWDNGLVGWVAGEYLLNATNYPTPDGLVDAYILSPNYNNRPTNTTIDAIVIHTTEGNYQGAIDNLLDDTVPENERVSAHYVIEPDGRITQMVDVENRAWHATYYNDRSIGIEVVGYAANSNTWTSANLIALEKLVASLIQDNPGIPVIHPDDIAINADSGQLDVKGIVGHSQVQPWNRYDPGLSDSQWADFIAGVQSFNSSTTGPAITSINPTQVTAMYASQTFTINGSEFDINATVTLRDLRTGEVFANRTISSQSSSQITINPNFTNHEALWSVEVINADGRTTGEYYFDVVVPVSSASLRLITPNGPEQILQGRTYPIRWLSTGDVGENVKIDLYRNGIMWQNLTVSTPNDGEYNWAVPIDQTTGADYTITVTSTADSSVTDTSDRAFIVAVNTQDSGQAEMVSAQLLPWYDLPDQTDGTDSLVIVTHGLNSSATDWVTQMGEGIASYLTDNGQTNWDVWDVNWSTESVGLVDSVIEQAELIGRTIGLWLQTSHYDYTTIHLVGHSAGATLIDEIASQFPTLGTPDRDGILIQATYLDAYLGGFRNHGINADWAEHYFNNNDLLDTNAPSSNAFDVDVTSLATDSAYIGRIDGHSWPWKWYLETILDPYDALAKGWGFARSIEVTSALPSHTIYARDAQPRVLYPLGSVDILDALNNWSYSGNGTAVPSWNSQDNVFQTLLTTGSPVQFGQLISTPDHAYTISFDYEFLTTTGTLEVWLGTTLLTFIQAPDGLVGQSSHCALTVNDIDLMSLNDVMLDFRLDGLTGSQVVLRDMQLEVLTAGGVDVHVISRLSGSDVVTLSSLHSADINSTDGTGGSPFAQREGTDFYVEMWVRSDQTNADGISSGSVELTFDAAYGQVMSVEHGELFTDSPIEVIDNTTGTVQLGGLTNQMDQGDDEYVLLGRVVFQGQVPVDEVNHVWDTQNLNLQVNESSLTFELNEMGEVTGTLQEVPTVSIRPMIYDVNDDGRVNFSDLGVFASAFREGAVSDDGPPYTRWADFNNDGRVNFSDLGLFASAFRGGANDTPGVPFPDWWKQSHAVVQMQSSSAPQTSANQLSLVQEDGSNDLALALAVASAPTRVASNLANLSSHLQLQLVGEEDDEQDSSIADWI